MTFGLGVDPNVKAILSAATSRNLKPINDEQNFYLTTNFW